MSAYGARRSKLPRGTTSHSKVVAVGSGPGDTLSTASTDSVKSVNGRHTSAMSAIVAAYEQGARADCATRHKATAQNIYSDLPCAPEMAVVRFYEKIYAPLLCKRWVQVLTLLALVVYWFFAGWGIYRIKIGFEVSLAVIHPLYALVIHASHNVRADNELHVCQFVGSALLRAAQ